VSRWVRYKVAPDPSIPETGELIRALESSLCRQKQPIDAVFRALTAFTHPRRVEIVRLLAAGGERLSHEVRAQTGISSEAWRRHVRKLMARKMVVRGTRGYRCACPKAMLSKTLLRIACRNS
jgi:hypothetical protein